MIDEKTGGLLVDLGSGYWIDATDGMNFTVRKGAPKNPRKKGKVIGYYPNLEGALRGAFKHGVATAQAIVTADRIESFVTETVNDLIRNARKEANQAEEEGQPQEY